MKDSAMKLVSSILFFSIFYVGAFGDGEIKEYASNLSVTIVALYAWLAILGVIAIESSNFEPIRYHPEWVQLIARSSSVGLVIISYMAGWLMSTTILFISLITIAVYKNRSIEYFNKLKN